MMQDKTEIDLDLDAALEAELSATPVELESAETLFDEDKPVEHVYEFEGIPRRDAIYLRGVDDMSTADITSYVNSPLLQKVQWINDSSCNILFETNDQALEVAQALLKEPSSTTVDHLTLLPAKPFVKEDRTFDLFIRIATDEDVKEKGSRAKSRYYQVHGVENESPREAERRKGRLAREERMSRNGGDGRDVFSRLGNRIPRRRSQSPSSDATRASGRERSIEREIPQHLKDRLGPKREDTA